MFENEVMSWQLFFLCGMFENEVMSWQLFLFLHTCVICIDVQLILEQRYNFFMNEQKGGAFFIIAG